MSEEKAKKKPKAERMFQHVYDSCITEGKPSATCDKEANGVVSKWKANQRKKHNAKADNLDAKQV